MMMAAAIGLRHTEKKRKQRPFQRIYSTKDANII
jgi:hypothetical protein